MSKYLLKVKVNALCMYASKTHFHDWAMQCVLSEVGCEHSLSPDILWGRNQVDTVDEGHLGGTM